MRQIDVIDIEASGLHFDSYPIELAVLVNGNARSWLIRPEANWTYWDETAENLHGISRQELLECGRDVATVVTELEAFLEGSTGVLYSDAAQWDEDWVNTLYHAAKARRWFHIGSVYELLGQEQHQAFDQKKAELGRSGKYRQHRAEADVRLIADSYREMYPG